MILKSLAMKGFEVKFGVLEKSIKVLEKSLKLFLKKGTSPVNSMTCWSIWFWLLLKKLIHQELVWLPSTLCRSCSYSCSSLTWLRLIKILQNHTNFEGHLHSMVSISFPWKLKGIIMEKVDKNPERPNYITCG